MGGGWMVGLLLAACASPPAGVAPADGEQAGGPDAGEIDPTSVTIPPWERVDGEYGLRVRFDGDSTRVSWLTRREGAGFLRVSVAGETVAEVMSEVGDVGRVHDAAFPTPDAEKALLHYGGAGDPEDDHDTVISLREPVRPAVHFDLVDSLYVMGDVHGEFETLVTVLANAGLVGGENARWIGGSADLVVLGDMMGRGDDATRVLWYLYRLERDAREAGGRVHIVLGNHEVMTMLGDLRYVAERETRLAHIRGEPYWHLYEPRGSLLGRWLASKPAVIRVGDVLFAHGGVSTEQLAHTVESHDELLAGYVSEDLFHLWADTTVAIQMDPDDFQERADFFWSAESVFWHRDYILTDTLGTALGQVLDHFESRVHVVAHTPAPGIRQHYDGRIIAVNTFPFAEEMLLLVRRGDRYERFGIGRAGPPFRLD